MQPTGDPIRRLTAAILDAYTFTALRTLARERLNIDVECGLPDLDRSLTESATVHHGEPLICHAH